ncbi:DUF1570 domain-containing protein [Paludisphaera rhizosphaerae]|uniref:DUF1570 domain-containing protein n=1 Tax=Paludisphaera rhizosphaerae TaxID=2711216 RepID=UPI001F117709|nr:DUF1570 domain-containing protein [Paludisphaera rhizosphaerae]
MLFLAVGLPSTHADLIYFRSGGRIQAKAVVAGGNVEIEVGGRPFAFRPEDFEKRVEGFIPAAEWEGRRRELASRTPAERFAGAWWALENGLVDEAVEELRRIHEAAPDHEPTRRMVAVADRLKSPCEDPNFEPFRQALGVPMRVARGSHVVLLHQHPEDEATERVAFLERVTTAFHLVFAGAGLSLETPRRRLVFAWFEDKSDYRAFLVSHDAGAFASTRGYFHPTWNAVLIYDARSSDLQRQDRATFAKRREELAVFRTSLEKLPANGRFRVSLSGERPRVMGRTEARPLADRLERDVRRGELLLEAERRAYDEGITAHEMVHLLAADSGLLPRHDAFPLWLQEGLAMQFEVVRGGRWAGIGRPHDIRLPDWRKIHPAPALEPLLQDGGLGRGYSRDPYVASWALVYFLRARKGDQFIRFLDLLRGPETVPSQEAFRRAFGDDLASLEREWREYLAAAQTPLEHHQPHPPTPLEIRPAD